ncbi:hypothetical protein D3C80_1436200 [compost metagenome]
MGRNFCLCLCLHRLGGFALGGGGNPCRHFVGRGLVLGQRNDSGQGCISHLVCGRCLTLLGGLARLLPLRGLAVYTANHLVALARLCAVLAVSAALHGLAKQCGSHADAKAQKVIVGAGGNGKGRHTEQGGGDGGCDLLHG